MEWPTCASLGALGESRSILDKRERMVRLERFCKLPLLRRFGPTLRTRLLARCDRSKSKADAVGSRCAREDRAVRNRLGPPDCRLSRSLCNRFQAEQANRSANRDRSRLTRHGALQGKNAALHPGDLVCDK